MFTKKLKSLITINCFSVFKTEVERDVVGDLKGDLKKLIIGLLQGNRDTTNEVDEELATEDAMVIFKISKLFISC